MYKNNKIHTIICHVLRVIQWAGKLIKDAFKPEYDKWLPAANDQESDKLVKLQTEQTENNSLAPTEPSDNVELIAKNKEIAELKAKLAAAEKEIYETKPFKDAYSKIIDTLNKNIGLLKGTYTSRGRPSKNRLKKTVKIDTTIIILFEYAKEIRLVDGDFSSFVNCALHDYLSGKYPAAYSIYEQALEEVDHVY